MLINYSKKSIKRICLDELQARKKLGNQGAKKLISRLADMEAASCVRELPPVGNPHPLKGARQGQFSVRLAGGDRIVFEPANEPVPKLADGTIDWNNVTEIRIVFIGDYHK